MYSDEFEKAFSEYLDSKECDAAEAQLFSLIRAAFAAGWAAGQKQRIIVLEQKETRR